ncbi:MAG: YkgJ family cysteine cluster protein [Bdellovibrio sp.]|nr:YkgJ family cysteine cluster protein [Bdellovibrio sp.]
MRSDVQRPETWRRYQKKMCHNCLALCCALPVEVTAQDLVRMRLLTEFDLTLGEKHLSNYFKKQKLIRSYNRKTEKFTLAQRANGDCVYLNEEKRCSIYDYRPETCRNHPRIGPRPNYCPHEAKI